MTEREIYFSERLSKDFTGDVLSKAVARVIANQDRYYRLLRSTKEPGIEDLIKSIHNSGSGHKNFFLAHSHSHHHYATGLVEHSLGVYDQMRKLYKGNELQEKDIILTALLHDICMSYNKEWPHIPGRHGSNSRLIAEKYLPGLSPAVKEAIEKHKHMPSPENAIRNPLWALVTRADRKDASTSPDRTLKFMEL